MLINAFPTARRSSVQYDRDSTRLGVLLKCKTEEGTVNVYRYLRAHEHKSKRGRMLEDGDIVACLHNTIFHSSSSSLDQSTLFNKSVNTSMNLTLPILSPPSPIQLTLDELKIRRAEIKKISNDSYEDDRASIDFPFDGKRPSPSSQSTPYSAGTIITPMTRPSFLLNSDNFNC